MTPSDNTLVEAMGQLQTNYDMNIDWDDATDGYKDDCLRECKKFADFLCEASGLTVEVLDGIRSGKNIVVDHEAMNNMVRDILQDNKFCMIEALNSPIERREG